MMILDSPQQSEQWFTARAGVVTASNFSKVSGWSAATSKNLNLATTIKWFQAIRLMKLA